MSIVLSKKQQEGLEIAVERFNNGETHTTIAGFAGTGKTTLVREIIREIGLSENEIEMATFTGKAALRLQQTGFPQARTLHKLLYKSVPKKGNAGAKPEFIHMKKPKADFVGIKLVIVDEVSMVPDNILHALAELTIPVIALGDPGQLPPVGRDNGMLAEPHIFLDEIQRQAEDNTIIKLSQQIRTGEKVDIINDDFIQMYSRDEVTPDMLLWADQVICGKNATRNGYNDVMRQALGFTNPTPMVGEKIIVTQNNWDFVNADNYSLVNGMIGEVTNSYIQQDDRAALLGKISKMGFLNFKTEFTNFEFLGVKYDALPMLEGKQSYNMDLTTKDAYKKVNGIDFGYVITCHKSQGSEFDKVVVFEEMLNSKEHRKWLYTAVTRASKKLVIIYDPRSDVWNV